MKQWRILLIVLGLIILLLVANFRYILQVHFDLRKSYILFHQVSVLLFFFFCSVQISTRGRRNSSQVNVSDHKKTTSTVLEKNDTIRRKSKRKSNSSGSGKFFGAVVEDNEKEGDKN